MLRNVHFQNINAGRNYPIAEDASCLSDKGVRLPNSLITDLKLSWPEMLGSYAFISSATIRAETISVTISAADRLSSPQLITPICAVTVPGNSFVAGKVYPLAAFYPEVFGYITFESNSTDYLGMFSTPRQTFLTPKAAKAHTGLPVKSASKLHSAVALTGIVELRAIAPLQLTRKQKTIQGVVRDVICLGLKEDATAVGDSGQQPQSVYSRFAGPCAARPDSGTCDIAPIEYINSVSPDCDGVICLNFSGTVVVGVNTDDCSVIVDVPVNLPDVCLPPRIPDTEGILPSEKPPAVIPIPPPPPPPPPSSDSDSIIIIGDLPYFNSLENNTEYLTDVGGEWTFISVPGPTAIDNNDSPGFTLFGKSYYGKNYYGENYWGGAKNTGTGENERYVLYGENFYSRAIMLWEGFDLTTFYRKVSLAVRLSPAAAGNRANGGIIVNYKEDLQSGLITYYIVEISHETQEFRLVYWNGVSASTRVMVAVPGIIPYKWYTLSVTILPGAGENVSILAELTGLQQSGLNATIGPYVTNNYRPETGLFGFTCLRAGTWFADFNLELFD